MKRTIYNVTRSTATGKRVNVGDFETIDAARAAMVEHYKQTPKRGKFAYTITQQELREIGGVLMRIQTLVICGENRPYYHKFTPEELKAM